MESESIHRSDFSGYDSFSAYFARNVDSENSSAAERRPLRTGARPSNEFGGSPARFRAGRSDGDHSCGPWPRQDGQDGSTGSSAQCLCVELIRGEAGAASPVETTIAFVSVEEP